MPPFIPLSRRALLGLGLALGLCAALPVQAETELRIGYQKSSTLIALLKARGTLEKALAAQDIRLSWHEFASGQPLLEALNVGNLDLSADVADTVPVFAQAAGAHLAYFAQEAPSPAAQAILVRGDAPLRGLADLRGRKVAVTKAAGSHYLLLAALASAGLKFSDIQPAYLTPADGRAAFENGKVDAWVTWEPFLSGAQRQLSTRTLADGDKLAAYQRYYLTSERFAREHPQVLEVVFAELVKAGDWLRTNPREAARILAPLWGNLDPAIVEQANGRRSYRVRPVQAESLAEQQKIADAFFAEGLLPKRVDARDVSIWQPQTAAR
ncbi:aliphatic sulfonate ABC transporter substrate-binding protein [Azotobacter chroococcum]|uniref:aliphatic sulfonate ABC transporter substrate-binding protein n=1 Tax=Azotobacter chroococcum TaxID=353 RepID=UPI00103A0A55|nr:aliphatic sulfonate ABC transporter substrate-binding protein [Azotobacter chroococcum]TBW40166.1 aliphatic sulfonate ABC transporter substrate-binding protein [Azotobacter chroococcum]TKD31182.1 aliphatic sulfonate ABC transporter substrate-binding protein [Azotobacter chroococcum]